MKIRNCLILAAGFGTRMGPIGKVLPKVLWPVYEKTLLQLQLDYAQSLGCTNVFCNTHFLHKDIESYVEKKDLGSLRLIHEPQLLRVGGAIHNIAALPEIDYKGNLLILNGDQFLFFDEDKFFRQISRDDVASLVGIEVVGTSYNELYIHDQRLEGIGEARTNKYITYSGVSVINLEKLNPERGPSNFFSSVANYKEQSVSVYLPEEYDYFDFGTTERYFYSIKRMAEEAMVHKNSKAHSFFLNMNAYDVDKFNARIGAYNSSLPNTYNFTTNHDLHESYSSKIVIKKNSCMPPRRGKGIVYCDQWEEVP